MSKSVGIMFSMLALPVMVVTAADVAPVAVPAPVPAVVAPAPASVPAAAVVEKKAVEPFRFGFDERIREEEIDKTPSTSSTAAGVKNTYFRFRTRLWAELDLMQDVTLGGRLINEFRKWGEPNKSGVADAATYVWPDEGVIDNLYLQIKNLAGFDIKVGRQDITDLSGRIIYEGTPEDGSRTLYFNAFRATYKAIDKTTIDVLAMYNQPQDPFAINTADRDLTGFTSNYDDMSESGGGIYVKNNTAKEIPVEVYGFFKREGDWTQATNGVSRKSWQTVENNRIVNAESDIYLAGFKVKPDLGGGVKSRLEAAYEFGTRGDSDLSAYMGDAGLSYDLPVAESLKPVVEGSWYYLSGDKSSTAKDEGWDPLWARFPSDSEALVLIYSRSKWSNLSMPTAKASMDIVKDIRATLAVSPSITAPEGSSTGDDMGNLYVAKIEFANLKQGMLSKSDKLSALLWFELLEPGDYFKSGTKDAYFARWQVTYTY